MPHSIGPLSIVVPTSSISDANQEVLMIYKEIVSGERWKGPYVKLTDPSHRCEIGRRVAQYGTSAIRYYKKKWPSLKPGLDRTGIHFTCAFLKTTCQRNDVYLLKTIRGVCRSSEYILTHV